MKTLKRTMYLAYYIRRLKVKQYRAFAKHASALVSKSPFRLKLDAVASVYKYNTSLMDYFQFRFFERSEKERLEWAGSGFMYEFQLKMNPLKDRVLLEDKIRFLEHFDTFVKRQSTTLSKMKEDLSTMDSMLNNPSGRLVLKNSHGQVGAEVEVVNCSNFTADSIGKYMIRKNYDLAEEFIVQHPDLMALSPSGVNTVRIFTALVDNNYTILGARLRISVNSSVDNMGAGNLAAPVDVETGVVTGPGVYSDIRKTDQTKHPVTGAPIQGFVIPFWKEVLALAKNASLLVPENKSVGWDIAITENGPDLIEGNHNWCKSLWQLPVKRGMKSELIKYL